jgi:D-amino-acid dehydrogenase
MKVVILGGGVVGVTTAWYLNRAGHEVVVLDRQPDAGLETSFANAGQLSYGSAAPWAAPGVPWKALKWLMCSKSPFHITSMSNPFPLLWLAEFWSECNEVKYQRNRERLLRLGSYSKDCLKNLQVDADLDFSHARKGTLQVFRSASEFEKAARQADQAREIGVDIKVVSGIDCKTIEPGLCSSRADIAGGLHFPGDETGDAHMFTQGLAKLAKARGVEFHYNSTVSSIRTRSDNGKDVVESVVSGTSIYTADAYVVALGAGSSQILKPLNIYIPMIPVKGYSLTFEARDGKEAPCSTVMDEGMKVAITRLGDKVRVGGIAELAGTDLSLDLRRREILEASVSDMFPNSGKPSLGKFWSGLRPMTPDGAPIIGGCKFKNLFMNTGHGSLGWTLACGSARVIADLVSGTAPDIFVDDLNASRFMENGGAEQNESDLIIHNY